MKKLKVCSLILVIACCMTGCTEKFEPTESTIFVTSEGNVRSVIVESFDKAYYDFDELASDVEKEVKTYNLDVNKEAVAVEALSVESDEVTLAMNYDTAETYEKFNEILLFCGTYAEALAAGYQPEELYDSQGQGIDLKDEDLADLHVIVTEESVYIQTAKKIKYVSDNVTVLDKKLAKAMEAGRNHPAYVLYK